MNWIATNIRFPEDLYMALKLEAARERKSVAAIIRERVAGNKTSTKKKAENLLSELARVASSNAKIMKDKSLSKLLLAMRSEQ